MAASPKRICDVCRLNQSDLEALIDRKLELEAENKRLRGEPTLGAAMNALMEEESKESLAQLYLEAIGRERRLRKCADAMADRLEDAYSQMAGGCECYNWAEMKRAAGDYRAAFPREEAKHG